MTGKSYWEQVNATNNSGVARRICGWLLKLFHSHTALAATED